MAILFRHTECVTPQTKPCRAWCRGYGVATGVPLTHLGSTHSANYQFKVQMRVTDEFPPSPKMFPEYDAWLSEGLRR